MYSMPLFVIPKLHSEKFHVVIDHSVEPHSLNASIPREKVSVKLDNIHYLGAAINRAHKANLSTPLTLIKSDVSTAYRLMPMHPLWQIRQIVQRRTPCRPMQHLYRGNR
jgi:hypothetical protein